MQQISVIYQYTIHLTNFPLTGMTTGEMDSIQRYMKDSKSVLSVVPEGLENVVCWWKFQDSNIVLGER